MTIVVSGGTANTDGAYTVLTFETSDTLTVAGGTLANVQYLLIAGGGNAAFSQSSYVAGGGAGGVLQGNVDIPAGSYPVVIGDTGNNSSFMDMTAVGGGVGGYYANGSPGGSGGGGGILGTIHINFNNFIGGSATAGQGWPGGLPGGGGYPPFGPGGGGGARGPGGTGGYDGTGGSGGAGIPSTITGTLEYYAAGGSSKGPGGIGPNAPGYTNYGAGGGYDLAESNYCNRLPAQPGVLILRYPTP